ILGKGGNDNDEDTSPGLGHRIYLCFSIYLLSYQPKICAICGPTRLIHWHDSTILLEPTVKPCKCFRLHCTIKFVRAWVKGTAVALVGSSLSIHLAQDGIRPLHFRKG